MRSIPVQQAQGMVLGHDITRIVPGEGKGPAFRKGHVITSEDIPALLRLGKEHISIWDLAEGLLHEDDAAGRIARAIAGDGVTLTQPCEGRINLLSDRPGLLKIDVNILRRLNSIEEVTIATLHGDVTVSPGQMLAGTRVVPLVVAQDRVTSVESICAESGPVVRVMPFRPLRIGVVTTGGEVITYGSPTFPGAMFMLAYLADIPVVGLPGCVMYHKASIFDLVVPRLVAGETLTRADIVELGHGGLCSMCSESRYPLCGFGKS